MAAERSPIAFLAARIARTNHLGLFIWICALILPAGLQLYAGMDDDVRSWLDAYYGAITLFFFFTLTFGFATVFATYYLLGGIRRSGSLEALKLSGVQPGEIVDSVALGMLRMLAPPMLLFYAGLIVYALIADRNGFIGQAGTWQLVAFALVQLLNSALLVLFLLQFLYRGSEFQSGILGLAAGMLAMVLNMLPIVSIVILGLPAWGYLLLVVATILLLRFSAIMNLKRLWRPLDDAL